MLSHFMSKIHSNEEVLKNILEPKNLKYWENDEKLVFTIDNRVDPPKKRSQFMFVLEMLSFSLSLMF